MAIAALVVPEPAGPPSRKATEPLSVQEAPHVGGRHLLFPLVASLIGLAIGAADGIVCRVARRALLGGMIGLLAGFVGGFVSGILAGLVSAPLSRLALEQQGNSAGGLTTFGFLVQLTGRSLGWCLAGMAMGLGHCPAVGPAPALRLPGRHPGRVAGRTLL